MLIHLRIDLYNHRIFLDILPICMVVSRYVVLSIERLGSTPFVDNLRELYVIVTIDGSFSSIRIYEISHAFFRNGDFVQSIVAILVLEGSNSNIELQKNMQISLNQDYKHQDLSYS